MELFTKRIPVRDVAESMTIQLASLESCASVVSEALKKRIIDVPKTTNYGTSLELLRPKLEDLKLSLANVNLSIKELEKSMKKNWN